MWESAASNTSLLFKKQFFLNESDLKGFVIEHTSNLHGDNDLSWFYLKPIALDYDNTKDCDSGKSCIAELKYSKKKLPNLNEEKLDLIKTGIINGPGNYIFSVWDNSTDTYYRVSIRRSDDYVGYITELFGVPFVYAPRHVKGVGHQTDNGLGADCIAVIIYGKRREGIDIPYFAPPKLCELTYKVGDQNSLTKAKIKRGDILHFGFQTAVLSKDVKPLGILTPKDKIIHCYHTYVEELNFSNLPYRDMPFDILRWE